MKQFIFTPIFILLVSIGGYSQTITLTSVGVGVAKMNVAATLLQLQDENLPFEQAEFSIAVKKRLKTHYNIYTRTIQYFI